MTNVLIVERDSSLIARISAVLDRERLFIATTPEVAAVVIATGSVDIGVAPASVFRDGNCAGELRLIPWIVLTNSVDEELAIHRHCPDINARYLYVDEGQRYLELLPFRLRTTTRHERVITTIADRFPGMVAYWDSRGRCRFANTTYSQWFGYPIEALLGMQMEAVLGDLYERNKVHIEKVLRGEPQRFESALKGRNGHPPWHAVVTYTPDIHEGTVIGFVVVVLDISEQLRLQNALVEREQRWATLFEILPVGVTVVNDQSAVIDQNEAIQSILGLGREGLENEQYKKRSYTDADGKPIAYADMPSTLARIEKRVVGPMEIGVLREDGSRVWLSVTAAPFPNEDQVVVVTRDITNEKINNERFKAIVDSSPIPYAINDDNGMITYLNPSFISTFGYTLEEIPNVATWWPLAYPDINYRNSVREEWLERLKKAKLEKTSLEPMEVTIRAKDGSIKIAIVGAVPLGQTLAGLYLIVFVDVTESRKTERQLEESRRLAGLGALAGGIAHDFNNLLTPIVVNTEIALAEAAPDSALAASLSEIRTAATRATGLIRQILALGRPEDETKKRVDLVPLVDEVVHLLRSALPPNITIVTDLDVDAPCVFANGTRIHRVITNLATNARDAMTPTGGTLTISVGRAGDNKVKLTVSDTGVGIAPEMLNRVFDPYFTTKRLTGGTGLGLATVQSIVNSLSGTIGIHSEVGKGTTVEVTLPAMPVDRRANARRKQSSPHAPVVTPSMVELHILVVDDEPMVARAAARMLMRLGHRVTIAYSPTEAIDKYRVNADLSLVLTDYTMPEMTGLALAKELYSIRPTHILLATGYAEQLTDEALREAHVKQVLAKPYGLATLTEALVQLAVKPSPKGASV